MKYQHTQVGKIIIGFVILSLIVAIVAISFEDFSEHVPEWMDTSNWNIWGIVIVTFVELLAISMSVLTIKVDKELVSWQFGLGFPRSSLAIEEIASVEQVRNKWWYGFGIRHILSGAKLYNVEGLDAIEMTTHKGKKIRLGTDDPKKLLRTLSTLIEKPEVS